MNNRFVRAAALIVALGAFVAASAPAQAASVKWTDKAGDATELGAANGGPNDPAFDVTDVILETVGDKFIWSAKVPAVTKDQPQLSSGYYFRFYFTHDGKDMQFIIAEDVTGAKTFSMSTRGTPSVSMTAACKDCKGVISREGKAVQVTVPLASLNAAMKVAEASPVAGKDFTGLQVLSQRRVVAATLTADTAIAPDGTAFTF